MKKLLSPLIVQLRSTCLGLALGVCALTVADVHSANAAQELVFTDGPFGRSLSIEELTTFAETGEASRSLRWYLNLAGVKPEVFQTILTRELDISLSFLDKTLNSIPGEYVLFQIGQIINSGSGITNIRALRSALLLSAADDNRVSLLEFLQNYPLQQITVDGRELAKVARDLGNVVEDVERRIDALVPVLKDLLGGVICDCETSSSTSDPNLSSFIPPAPMASVSETAQP